jgi:signal transduction histidine kinase
VVYNRQAQSWLGWHREPRSLAFDPTTGARAEAGHAGSAAVRALLDTDSFVSVPLSSRNEPMGRLYLTTRRRGFSEADARFLLQISDHLLLVIQNIRLVDRLAADAADQERQRIARDIHDSVVQPYIGLQLGLMATAKKITAGGDVTTDLHRLISLAGVGITDLRSFVRELTGESERGAGLLPAVQRFAGKFTEATGINVRVEAPVELSLPDRLTTEVFQMVSEGLSNIRRHTQAQQAVVSLACREDRLVLRVENDQARGDDSGFIPHSITARAVALGGKVRVAHPDPDHTHVIVEIPL